MGTPGDKIDIGEIVSDADPNDTPLPQQRPSASVPGPAAAGPSTDMTVLGYLPQFNTFVSYGIGPTTSMFMKHCIFITSHVLFVAVKLEPLGGLEQARIEDYFSHSKSASQSILLSAATDQPGPSGLQNRKQKRAKRPATSSQQAPKKAHICQVLST